MIWDADTGVQEFEIMCNFSTAGTMIITLTSEGDLSEISAATSRIDNVFFQGRRLDSESGLHCDKKETVIQLP